MAGHEYEEFPCDLCGSREAVELPHSRELSNGEPIHICRSCGFVYVVRRRSAHAVADVWSMDLFGKAYTSAIPAVISRLTYVAELVDAEVGLRGKTVVEVGAGEGRFLDVIRQPRFAAEVAAIEPSETLCEALRKQEIQTFHGTIEDVEQRGNDLQGTADVAAILWTLENCVDCRRMLCGVHRLLKPGGHIVVATGSRILVPFKKPLYTYISRTPADTHAFRFSARTLQGILAVTGFETTYVNRYLDHDVLCVIARKVEESRKLPWEGDSYLDVHNFFERWYVDTTMYFPDDATRAGLQPQRLITE